LYALVLVKGGLLTEDAEEVHHGGGFPVVERAGAGMFKWGWVVQGVETLVLL
jgi:hypothetical protein